MVLALCFAACGKAPQAGETQATLPIAFSASMTESKASGEIPSTEALKTGGFGVFACYTGLYHYSESSVSSDFMHNQPVWWDYTQSVWDYSPVKYWPNGEGEDAGMGHMVSFFAYAPYSDGDPSFPATNPVGYCISSFCNPSAEGDPWLIYRLHTDPDKQVDLLYSVPVLDQTKPEVGHRLPFAFKHAMACVGDKVTLSLTDALKTQLRTLVDGHFDKVELVLTGVELRCTLTEKAKLVLWNKGTANWQPVLSEGVTTSLTRTVFSGEQVLYGYDGSVTQDTALEKNGLGVYYIPLEVGGNAQSVDVMVSFVIRSTQDSAVTDTEHVRSYTLSLRDYCKEGSKLDINISLNTL